jgi:hypothetical protein
MQLTGTNSSIDLIVLIINIHQAHPMDEFDSFFSLTPNSLREWLREGAVQTATASRPCEHKSVRSATD